MQEKFRKWAWQTHRHAIVCTITYNIKSSITDIFLYCKSSIILIFEREQVYLQYLLVRKSLRKTEEQ